MKFNFIKTIALLIAVSFVVLTFSLVKTVRAFDIATVTVGLADCDYTDLQKAIDDAATGPTIIVLMEDILVSGTVFVKARQNITLTSGDHGPYKIDAGGGNFTVITNSGKLSLTQIKVTGANSTDLGGGIYNNGILFMWDGAVISGNTAKDGGGVYNCGVLNLEYGAKISNNASRFNIPSGGGFGGGVWNQSVVTMEDGSEISHNRSDTYGGGVYNYDRAEFIMNGGKISGNEAIYGGGVYNSGEAWDEAA